MRLLIYEQFNLGPHCLSLYLTLLNNVSKNLQQTTTADRIFRLIFAGVFGLIACASFIIKKIWR